jgi:hypothetical protein
MVQLRRFLDTSQSAAEGLLQVGELFTDLPTRADGTHIEEILDMVSGNQNPIKKISHPGSHLSY